MGIRFEEKKGLFSLTTDHTLYQMKADEAGMLLHLYYGPRTEEDMSYLLRFADRGFAANPYDQRENRAYSPDLLPQEYSTSGAGDYRIPALLFRGENGSATAELRYGGYRIPEAETAPEDLPHVREAAETETLEIRMKDAAAGLAVLLRYRVFPREDVIVRSAVIRNEGDAPLRLEKAASACLDFLHIPLQAVHFHGRWAMERTAERLALPHGVTAFGSRRGMSSHQHNPFVILCGEDAGEDRGDCCGVMLMYSGNHLEEIEVDQTGGTRLTAGIHPEGFSWLLAPGEAFETPEAILSFSGEGFNGLSRQYHRLIRRHVIPPEFREGARPVLINNWEATYFDFNAEKILRLADVSRELGVEMLVLDDGWFGRRNDDRSGLGDWTVNEEKLGCSLGELSRRIHAKGMKFGLWFEPEMVSEDSDLFRAHPDWALRDPDRKPVLSRDQLVLDMSRPEVTDYLFGAISAVADEAGLDYIKWDFNRSVANLWSRGLPAGRQGELGHRFMLGTYSLLRRLRARYPRLMIEGCSGGGGRFDAGMLYYCPQIWCSDDTDAVERLEIQRGTSYGYPASAVGAHVSACPNHQTGRNTPLGTRGTAAMAGTFGYEMNPGILSPEEKEIIREQIRAYHRFGELIRQGDYYRLTELDADRDFEAWMFVAPDGGEALVSVVTTRVRANALFPWIRLRGLRKDRKYRLEGTDTVLDGGALMTAGYCLPRQSGDYPAAQMHWTAC